MDEINEDIVEVKSNLQILTTEQSTLLVVIASNPMANTLTRIHVPKGEPIGNFCYDTLHDCYSVDCADYLHLGDIPISFQAFMEGVIGWKVKIPVPEILIEKYLSDKQKKDLNFFKSSFNPDTHGFSYLQSLFIY